MAPDAIHDLFIAETYPDQFWNRNVHKVVLAFAMDLERNAYEDLYLDVIPSAPGDKHRLGVLFQTPLSQTVYRDIKVQTEKIKAVEGYIEWKCGDISEYLDSSDCGELLHWFRRFLEDENADEIMKMFIISLGSSYEAVRYSMLAHQCEKEFCQQLGDQLVFCKKCGQRPILYNVIKDGDSMRQHVRNHKRENENDVKQIEHVEKMLLKKLEGSLDEWEKTDTEMKGYAISEITKNVLRSREREYSTEEVDELWIRACDEAERRYDTSGSAGVKRSSIPFDIKMGCIMM